MKTVPTVNESEPRPLSRPRRRPISEKPANASEIINEKRIEALLASAQTAEKTEIREILAKAKELQGLSMEEVARLLTVEDADMLAEMGQMARWVKEEIYGRRLVFFAPLYLSNECVNNCLYCAFRKDNKSVARATLNMDQIREEVEACERIGQKRLLLLVGEFGPLEKIVDYLEEAIATVYRTKNGPDEVRRVNINVPAMEVEHFKRLKEAGIGTYQLFQETYRRATFDAAHPSGPKGRYEYHLQAMDRAQLGGVDDVGIGALLGLDDYRFEVLAMIMHAEHLDRTFGTGPHTISVPRINPAEHAPWSEHPPKPLSDDDFKKAVMVLRLAVPYTGIILSTRESPSLRREVFALGISQLSAGSRTQPGGYKADDPDELAQFSLGDHRPLDEVLREVASLGYIPSFCTSCYRSGRTGMDFMDLAKPGLIKQYCLPNALSTFAEYLEDYASEETKGVGLRVIEEQIAAIDSERLRQTSRDLVERVRKGQRDVMV